jgi:hypothetical protein
MAVDSTASKTPKFIDRLRDLIGKLFGRPGREPHDMVPPAHRGAAADTRRHQYALAAWRPANSKKETST